MSNYDVAIVGAGIAGFTQALALSQAGLSIALIDQGEAPDDWHATDPWDTRVVALTRASQGLFERLGVWDECLARRATPYEKMALWWADHAAQAIMLEARQVAVTDLGHIVEQRVIRDALWQKLRDTCAFYWSTRVEAFEYKEGLATLSLPQGVRIQAALVIAADGAQSPMRHALAIPSLQWSYGARAIVATIESSLGHQRIARQVFHSEGTLAMLPLSDPQVSSLVWSVPEARAAALLKLSPEAFMRALGRGLDGVLGTLSLLSSPTSFYLQTACSQVFAQAGIAFIADAAHVVHPLAGQGLNLGLTDIACLTDIVVKARARQRPIGHASILKPYARARKVAAQEMMLLMSLLEKAGRFSAKHAAILSQWLVPGVTASPWLKTFTTMFALHSLNQ